MADKAKLIKKQKPKAKPAVEVKDRKDLPVIPPNPLATAMDPYVSARQRMERLPTVGEALSAERIQGLFAHMLLMSPKDLQSRMGEVGVSVLEIQIITMIQRSLRDLKHKYVQDKDKNGKPKFNKNGEPIMIIDKFHKDTVHNERYSLETIKYMHERGFGKTPLNVIHSGIGGGPIAIEDKIILQAMDNLPKNVIDVIAKNMLTGEKKPKDV